MVLAPPPVGDPAARRAYFYSKYNLERAAQVEAALALSPELEKVLAGVAQPQEWLVLTEAWCGDSAFSLPVIARAAAANRQITLRILPRDAHPGVMDRFLTNGARSIPKLVAFDDDGAVLFAWGPRPAAAVAYRNTLLASGHDKAQTSAMLMRWYEEGGWRAVGSELAALLYTVPAQ